MPRADRNRSHSAALSARVSQRCPPHTDSSMATERPLAARRHRWRVIRRVVILRVSVDLRVAQVGQSPWITAFREPRLSGIAASRRSASTGQSPAEYFATGIGQSASRVWVTADLGLPFRGTNDQLINNYMLSYSTHIIHVYRYFKSDFRSPPSPRYNEAFPQPSLETHRGHHRATDPRTRR